MYRIKQKTVKVTPIKHSKEMIDVTPGGVRIIHKKENEPLPADLDRNDPSIHTIIIFNTDTKSVSISKRRDEEPEIRKWVDPRTFIEHDIETLRWDTSFSYKGRTTTYTIDFPTTPIKTISQTLEQKQDENNLH